MTGISTGLPLRTDLSVSGRAEVREAAIEATVAALGTDGDGLIRADGETWFTPYVLPGERVRVRPGKQLAAALEAVLEASADRVVPPCGLFGRCGGCVLQHAAPAAMARFKQGLVQDALVQAGFTLPAMVEFAAAAPRSRRRMDLALRRTADGLLIGLHRRADPGTTGSRPGNSKPDDVVDMIECHVLEPRLFALIGAMRPVLLRLSCLRGNGSMIVNLLDSGPDILLATDVPPDSADRSRLADFAREARIPRIAWRPLRGGSPDIETVCSTAPVHHDLSGTRVSPPPGAFLQASRDSEVAIIAAVLAGLPERLTRSARIVELFAGCGTLSFALAGRARLLALDGQKDAVACLRGAASGRLEALQRDLVRQPLLAVEFARAVAIVLDPPFAGVGPQMPEVARSGVACVIMVSCNPRALRQDAGLLHAAGYRLERLAVIDQFLWSSGVESVSVFVKPRR